MEAIGDVDDDDSNRDKPPIIRDDDVAVVADDEAVVRSKSYVTGGVLYNAIVETAIKFTISVEFFWGEIEIELNYIYRQEIIDEL